MGPWPKKRKRPTRPADVGVAGGAAAAGAAPPAAAAAPAVPAEPAAAVPALPANAAAAVPPLANAAAAVLAWPANAAVAAPAAAAAVLALPANAAAATPARSGQADARASAVALQSMALAKYLAGEWSANDVTSVAWHVERMGHGSVLLAGLARKPNARDPYHNCSRTVERALGFAAQDAKWYRARIPMNDAIAGCRVLKEMAFCLPHMLVEKLGAEAGATPLLDTPSFLEHPVTKRSGAANTVALGMFADGTDFTSEDSIIVFSANINGLPERHCMAAVEKAALCQCGCKGTCTILAVSRILTWSFNAAAAGRHPARQHDECMFPPVLGGNVPAIVCRSPVL